MALLHLLIEQVKQADLQMMKATTTGTISHSDLVTLDRSLTAAWEALFHHNSSCNNARLTRIEFMLDQLGALEGRSDHAERLRHCVLSDSRYLAGEPLPAPALDIAG